MATKPMNLQVIGKHIVNGFLSRAVAYGLFSSRNVNTLGYDKNVEEVLESSKVPEEMIKPDSDKYWSPHPKTGVFGPSSAFSNNTIDENRDGHKDSIMEEKAWFRQTSLEDFDKTHHS